eukprot:SAG11_NODE_2309_length_3542_cov_2.410398_2_plen_418_part_00
MAATPPAGRSPPDSSGPPVGAVTHDSILLKPSLSFVSGRPHRRVKCALSVRPTTVDLTDCLKIAYQNDLQRWPTTVHLTHALRVAAGSTAAWSDLGPQARFGDGLVEVGSPLDDAPRGRRCARPAKWSHRVSSWCWTYQCQISARHLLLNSPRQHNRASAQADAPVPLPSPHPHRRWSAPDRRRPGVLRPEPARGRQLALGRRRGPAVDVAARGGGAVKAPTSRELRAVVPEVRERRRISCARPRGVVGWLGWAGTSANARRPQRAGPSARPPAQRQCRWWRGCFAGGRCRSARPRRARSTASMPVRLPRPPRSPPRHLGLLMWRPLAPSPLSVLPSWALDCGGLPGLPRPPRSPPRHLGLLMWRPPRRWRRWWRRRLRVPPQRVRSSALGDRAELRPARRRAAGAGRQLQQLRQPV